MFLILGTSECKYCLESKKLLDSLSLNYKYIDLLLEYGINWRTIFKTLSLKQKTIPIIFHQSVDDPIIVGNITIKSLEEWTLLGGYSDLIEFTENQDISISDDY